MMSSGVSALFKKRQKHYMKGFPIVIEAAEQNVEIVFVQLFLHLLAVQPGLILNRFVGTGHILCLLYRVRVLWKPEKF